MPKTLHETITQTESERANTKNNVQTARTECSNWNKQKLAEISGAAKIATTNQKPCNCTGWRTHQNCPGTQTDDHPLLMERRLLQPLSLFPLPFLFLFDAGLLRYLATAESSTSWLHIIDKVPRWVHPPCPCWHPSWRQLVVEKAAVWVWRVHDASTKTR